MWKLWNSAIPMVVDSFSWLSLLALIHLIIHNFSRLYFLSDEYVTSVSMHKIWMYHHVHVSHIKAIFYTFHFIHSLVAKNKKNYCIQVQVSLLHWVKSFLSVFNVCFHLIEYLKYSIMSKMTYSAMQIKFL